MKPLTYAPRIGEWLVYQKPSPKAPWAKVIATFRSPNGPNPPMELPSSSRTGEIAAVWGAKPTSADDRLTIAIYEDTS